MLSSMEARLPMSKRCALMSNIELRPSVGAHFTLFCHSFLSCSFYCIQAAIEDIENAQSSVKSWKSSPGPSH